MELCPKHPISRVTAFPFAVHGVIDTVEVCDRP
jgi:hypothetical protein